MDVLLSSWGSLASGVMDVGLSLWVSLTTQVMKVGLSSRVDLSSNIKRGWESSTDGGNGMSIIGWGSDGSWSMGIANSGEDSSLGSKVISLGSGNSGLVIGGDSAVGVNPQAKGSSSKPLGTSIAVSGGISSTVMA